MTRTTTLSRRFACQRCGEPIHEARGEENHIEVSFDGGSTWDGPYHAECADAEMREAAA